MRGPRVALPGSRPPCPPSLPKFDRPRLADERHLDLTGVFELALDLAGDLAREQQRGVVVDRRGLGDDADLAAGLHRVDLLDAGGARGEPLGVAAGLDV